MFTLINVFARTTKVTGCRQWLKLHRHFETARSND